ncbi:MAG: N-acetylmuramoyl-L-alanine amidase [Mobilitalea sp.]
MRICIDVGFDPEIAGKKKPSLLHDIETDKSETRVFNKEEQEREHAINVGVARYLSKEMERCNVDVYQTGWSNDNSLDYKNISLIDRQRAIVRVHCDYVISLHYKVFSDIIALNDAEDIGIYVHDKFMGQSELLANSILKYLSQGRKSANREIHQQSLAMCNCNIMDVKGAVFIELAYLDNLHDATEFIVEESALKESAVNIWKGFCEYAQMKYIPENKVPDTIPKGKITPRSSKEDIKWAQEKLNMVLPTIANITPLVVNGKYDAKTRLAVLLYWDLLEWGQDMGEDGTKIGFATKEALEKGRKR